MAKTETLIDPKTAAEDYYLKVSTGLRGASLQVVGDLASDVITIMMWDGTTSGDPAVKDYDQAVSIGGDALTLTATNNILSLDKAMDIVIRKPSTANAVGVQLIS